MPDITHRLPPRVFRNNLRIYRTIDLDESEEEVSAVPITVHGWCITNTATTTRFIKFYNDTAAAVLVGTTVPVFTWGIPGNASDDVSAHISFGEDGIEFTVACSIAATTGVADADVGAPGVNDVIMDLFYKKSYASA